VRIVVVDDHRFMREVIAAMLRRQDDRCEVLAEASDAKGAIEVCQRFSPDLVLLDINLPDFSGIDLVPRIKKACGAEGEYDEAGDVPNLALVQTQSDCRHRYGQRFNLRVYGWIPLFRPGEIPVISARLNSPWVCIQRAQLRGKHMG
jgi:CheY-like chemotaxis protein